MRRFAVGGGMLLVSVSLALVGCNGSSTPSQSASPSESSVVDASWCAQVDQIANTESPSVESMRNLQSAMGSDIPSKVHDALENGINDATISPDDWAVIQVYIEQECPSYPSAS